MPRHKKGIPPAYRHHRPTNQAVVTISGRDIYLGKYDSPASKVEYARIIAEYAVTGAITASPETDQGITIVEVLAAFWRFAKTWYVKDGKPTNELDAFRVLMRDVKRLYGHTPAADFGPLAFKAVRQVWIDRGQSRPTINKNAGRLKRLFKWAASEELIPVHVHQSLTTVEGLRKGRCQSPEPAPVLPVQLAVVEATLPHLPQVTADMVRFQLLTGARPGEVCMLTPAAVDRSGEVWEYNVDGHKTEHHGRSRTVYIGPEAQRILSPYLLRASDEVCFSMAESLEQRRQKRSEARTTPLNYGNRRGHRNGSDRKGLHRSRKLKNHDAFNATTYRHAIHYACDEAFPAPPPLAKREGESNVARMQRLKPKQQEELAKWQKEHRWSPNQLRHTRGTEIRKNFGLEAAQVILGHAAADVTQIYAERDADLAKSVVRKIG